MITAASLQGTLESDWPAGLSGYAAVADKSDKPPLTGGLSDL
jgi:hypothetical protein